MQIFFENKYIRNEEWAKDCFKYICFRRPVIIFFDVVMGIYLLAGIISLLINKSVDWFYVFFPLVWITLSVFLYFKNVNTVIKRDLEMHGKPIEITVAVTDECINQFQSTGSQYQLRYGDIKKVVQTKRYILLHSKTNMLYTLKKDSFTWGNESEFLAFLRSKGIKVR